jgi:YidC/Oxa1 family membrane protein insertase
VDRIRFALWFGLLAAVWMSYTTWVTENQPDPPIPATGDTVAVDAGAEMPSAPAGQDLPQLAGPAPDNPEAAADAPAPGRLISVRTDVLDLRISLDGGDIVRVVLPAYPIHKDAPYKPVRLLD